MAFTVTEVAQSNVLEIEITGTLTKDAYADFVPRMEQMLARYDKLRLLVRLHDFHGWTAGALWEDVKFDFKHFSDIERLAIVGEKKWEKGMSVFCKAFTTAAVEYFEPADLEIARTWVRA